MRLSTTLLLSLFFLTKPALASEKARCTPADDYAERIARARFLANNLPLQPYDITQAQQRHDQKTLALATLQNQRWSTGMTEDEALSLLINYDQSTLCQLRNRTG